jgi:hemerythrin-like domain-containing protein
MRAAVKNEALQDFVEHARAYVELLRNHIFKEDHRLFPMANQVFSKEDQTRLTERFEHVENQEVDAGAHEKYLDIADMLAERFHVPRASRTGCGCGHGH